MNHIAKPDISSVDNGWIIKDGYTEPNWCNGNIMPTDLVALLSKKTSTNSFSSDDDDECGSDHESDDDDVGISDDEVVDSDDSDVEI